MSDPGATRVALLVVHGIGEQEPGATAEKVVSGFKKAYPNEFFRPPNHMSRDHTITFGLLGSKNLVTVYEVYWADLCRDHARGSFNSELVQAMALFPLKNRRHHMYTPSRPAWRINLSAPVLLILSFLVYVGIYGLRLLINSVSYARTEPKIRVTTHGNSAQKLVQLSLASAKSSREYYGPVDRVLDGVPGDVVQYVDGSAPRAPAPTVADMIRGRFRKRLNWAKADGCEQVHVLAHSLGTVIAFHAMTGYRSEAEMPIAISGVWTIGSPLEKIAYFFPAMTARSAGGGHKPRWVNFRNPLDIVSGRLRSIPNWHIDNQTVWIGGVGRSHVVYERNHHVIEHLSRALFSRDGKLPFPMWARLRGLLESIVESALVLAALLIPVVVGAVVFVAPAWIVAWLMGTVVGLFASDSIEAGVKAWGALGMALMFVFLLAVFGPIDQAEDLHRSWRDETPQRGA